MRILYLSQLVPYPLDAGPKVRQYFVLRRLAEAGHVVTLLAFRRESDTDAAVAHLREFCAEVHTVPMRRSSARDAVHLARSLVTREPFLIARDRVNAMTRRVRELASGGAFDALHADQLWMASYALEAAGASRKRPRLVLDQHNAMALIPERLAASTGNPVQRALWRREAAAMRRYEPAMCRRFDVVVWVTSEDRAAVGVDGPVIPICVDPVSRPVIDRLPDARRVTFLGGLHWPPNAAGILWFAREVWPQVRAACPDAVLTVIGKNPPSGLSMIPGTEVTGYVEDTQPHLAETAAFIVPLHAGGGMRVKILDAWCWGLPVVATSIGAEGITYRSGQDILIADEVHETAAAVIGLLRDPSAAARLAAGGRCTVETLYDWRVRYLAWDEIYGSAS